MSDTETFAGRLCLLTEEAKQKVFERKARLLEEGWDEERAEMMSVGILPKLRKRWPPTLRYRLATAMKNTGLRRGTQSYADKREIEEQKIRDWLDRWFWRNHQKQGESK